MRRVWEHFSHVRSLNRDILNRQNCASPHTAILVAEYTLLLQDRTSTPDYFHSIFLIIKMILPRLRCSLKVPKNADSHRILATTPGLHRGRSAGLLDQFRRQYVIARGLLVRLLCQYLTNLKAKSDMLLSVLEKQRARESNLYPFKK